MTHPEYVWTIITRLLMAIMMHYTVEPDIRNGISIMKYAVNHPWQFKQKKKGQIDFQKVIIGFYLGFTQAVLGIIIEFLAIWYLACLSKLLDIITKFVSMSRLAMIDNFFAQTLNDESIKRLSGKILPTEYKRFMYFFPTSEYRSLIDEVENN